MLSYRFINFIQQKGNRYMFKRLFDFFVAAFALITFAPVIVCIFIIERKKLGASCFFQQKRPGLYGKVFNMFKFRSMLDGVDTNGEILQDNERLTPFGEKLRNISSDKLPGLWSVLKDYMSLVGPRAFLIENLPLYNEQQAKRHDVKSGITGWAQINGRNTLSWKEKFDLDVWYVENHSFWLDIKIVFLTVKKVVVKADISADGEVTMSKFTGSKNNV